VSGYLRDNQLRRQLEEKVKEATRTRQAAEDGIKAASAVLDAAKRNDADVTEAMKPLAEAESAMGAKDYKLAAEKAEEAKERGTRIYRDRARTILGSSEELANLARGVGGDVSEADAALRRSRDALDSDDVTGAIDHAKKAWKRSEKVLLEHLSSSFSKAQALILSAKNLGRDVGPVEDLLSRARSAMEGSDFPAALGFTQEGLETITEDLKSVLEKEVQEAEDLLRTAQELGADATRPASLIGRARGDIANLEFEKARNSLKQSRGESEKALQKTLEGKIADFSKFIQDGRDIGADTAAAEGHFARSEALIRQRNFTEGGQAAKQGFQALQQAQFQRVLQTIAASREKFVAAVNLGVDLSGAIAHLNKAREALQRNAFREALDAARKADEGVDSVVGRYRAAEDRLRDLHRSFADAETLGVDTTSARRAAERAREAYQARDPAGLESAIGTAFEELRKAERERTMQVIEQTEFVLTLGERNGVDLDEASQTLQEAILGAKAQEFLKALELAGKAQASAEAAMQRHLSEGTAGLRAALPHLGDDAAAVKALVNRGEASSASRDFDGAFGALEEGRRAIEGHTRVAAKQAVEDLGLVVQMGVDLGSDVAGVEALFKEVNAHLGAGRTEQVLAARDRVKPALSTASEALFNLVKVRVAQARDLKIDIDEMLGLLRQSRSALSVENYHEGLARLKDANDRAGKATAIHRHAQSALSGAAALVAEARKRDVDVTKVLEMLLDAKKAFERMDYERTMELAAQTRRETEKLMVLYTSAQKILSSRERLDLAARLGIDVPHLRDSLTEAKEAMKAKDYDRALAAATKAEEETTGLIRERIGSMLSQSEAVVASVPGVNLAALTDEIGKAKGALEAGRFAPAAESALHLRDHLGRLKGQSAEADAASRRVRDLVADVEAMDVELPATARLMEKADRAYKMGQFEEALDFLAEAEAEAVKERDAGIAATMRRFEDTIARAKREGTDTRSAEKLLDRAREFLRGKKYRQALAIAMQSEGEAERVALQQGLATQAVQTAERKLQGLGSPIPDVAKIVAEARAALASGDYVKALDSAIRATDAFGAARQEMDEAAALRDRAHRLLQNAKDLDADAVKLERMIEEADEAFAAGDYAGAEEAYAQAQDWGAGLLRDHLKGVLAKAEQTVATCRKLGVDPTSALNEFAQARTRIETGDFAEAYMRVVEGRHVAEAALGARLNATLAEAASSIAHAKKLGTDAREAEERLRDANRRIAQGEYDAALGLVERALEHVESVKLVEKRFVDLSYKAESTIRNGKKFGIDMRAAEKRLADSMGLRKSDLSEAIRTAEEAYRIAWEAVEAFAPSLDASLEIGPARLNEWTDAALTLTNTGKGLAKDVQVKILGDAETEGLAPVAAVRAKGSETLKLRIKMTAPGSVPLAIQITAHRVFDDKAYTREMIAQVDVAEEARDKPKRLVADLESRCPICKGLIKKGFKVLRCGCGRDFHDLCASRVGRCPVCFRPLGAAAE